MKLSWIAFVCAVPTACMGSIDGSAPPEPTTATTTSPADPGARPTPAAAPAPGERITDVSQIDSMCNAKAAPTVSFMPLRRLNQHEYANTVRDLFGITGVADGFVSDSRVGTFFSNADVAVSDLQADQYRDAANAIAAKATGNLGALVKCAPADGEACAASFIRDFGLKAFRRPLTADEQAGYLGVYRVGIVRGGFAGGIGLVLRALLQSPHFLYLVERTPVGKSAAVPLGPYETATRLSYLIWGSLPDDQLFAAAARGELATPAQLRAQAMRMLADPRAKDALAEFQMEWLQLVGLESLEKDATLFPRFDQPLRQAMRDEIANFMDAVVGKGDADLATLFTASYSVLTPPLLKLYGATAPATATGPMQITFAPGQRSGILTQAAFLATHAHQNQGSPVKRGVLVRQAIMCQDLPPPPANVNNAVPPVDPKLTTRQRFAQHDADPACAGCHSLIDGIGFAFERYDAVGAYRATESNQPIDDSGNLIAASPEIEGPFRGPAELGRKLTSSDVGRRCFVTQWFRFAFKRAPTVADACAASAMTDAFASSRQNVRELLLSIVGTSSFRYGVGER